MLVKQHQQNNWFYDIAWFSHKLSVVSRGKHFVWPAFLKWQNHFARKHLNNVSHYQHLLRQVQILFYGKSVEFKFSDRSVGVVMIHNSQQRQNLESEMEMMSVWRQQISNVISVWMWNIRQGNQSCDGLGILLVPVSRLILWRPEGQHRPSVVKTYHIMNRTPILFLTDFIYSESRWKKHTEHTHFK